MVTLQFNPERWYIFVESESLKMRAIHCYGNKYFQRHSSLYPFEILSYYKKESSINSLLLMKISIWPSSVLVRSFSSLAWSTKVFLLLVQYVYQTNKHTGISAKMLPYYLFFISHLHSIAIIQFTMFPVCALLLLFVVVVVVHYTWPCSTESHFCARSTSENCACHWRIYFYGTR